MILGIGCDICRVERFRDRIDDARFLSRILTENEQKAVRGCEKRKAEHIAGIFAAKEAVAKALGTGFAGFMPTDLEILPDACGAPKCMPGEKVRILMEAKGAGRIWVSVSHESDAAVAFAVLEGGD